MTETPQPKSGARSIAVMILVLALAAAMAMAGSDGGARVGAVPVFAGVVAWIFAVQIVAFIPAWIQQSEHFFDLIGSLTYITAIWGAVLLSGQWRDQTDYQSYKASTSVLVPRPPKPSAAPKGSR